MTRRGVRSNDSLTAPAIADTGRLEYLSLIPIMILINKCYRQCDPIGAISLLFH